MAGVTFSIASAEPLGRERRGRGVGCLPGGMHQASIGEKPAFLLEGEMVSSGVVSAYPETEVGEEGEWLKAAQR